MWHCHDFPSPSGVDDDVVGFGTLIAFGVSSCVAVTTLLVHYLFFYRVNEEGQERTSPVDVVVLSNLRFFLRRCFRLKSGPSSKAQEDDSRIRDASDQFVLALLDVQLGLGFAALIYGCVSMFTSGLSAYSWWLIVALSWFSVVSDLAAISYLRSFRIKHPGRRIWRLVLLISFLVLLVIGMIPTIQMKEVLASEDDDGLHRLQTTNALCYFPGLTQHHDWSRREKLSTLAVLYIVIFVSGLAVVTSILRRFEKPGSVVRRWSEHYRGEMRSSVMREDGCVTCIRCEHRTLLLLTRPALALWLVVRLYTDLVESIMTEVFLLVSLLVWVSLRFFDIWKLAPAADWHWTFGQVIALVCFAAPLTALAEYLCGHLRRPRLNPRSWSLPRVHFPSFPLPWGPRKAAISEEAQAQDNGETQSLLSRDAAESVMTAPVIQPANIETNDWVHEEEEVMRAYRHAYTGIERRFYFDSPWFNLGLPIAATSTLVYVVLLFTLPRVGKRPTTKQVLRRTLFWYLVGVPFLTLIFVLTSMAMEERVRPRRRARKMYRIISGIVTVLSVAAIVDTLWGVGGIPMSYIAMGTIGFWVLIYLLYGCVAAPGRLAKGKDRSYMGDGDVEEGARAQLLAQRPSGSNGNGAKRSNTFPVHKKKTWHGPVKKGKQPRRKSYGTMSEILEAQETPDNFATLETQANSSGQHVTPELSATPQPESILGAQTIQSPERFATPQRQSTVYLESHDGREINFTTPKRQGTMYLDSHENVLSPRS